MRGTSMVLNTWHNSILSSDYPRRTDRLNLACLFIFFLHHHRHQHHYQHHHHHHHYCYRCCCHLHRYHHHHKQQHQQQHQRTTTITTSINDTGTPEHSHLTYAFIFSRPFCLRTSFHCILHILRFSFILWFNSSFISVRVVRFRLEYVLTSQY